MGKLAEIVKNKNVYFTRYRKGELIYTLEDSFEFAVPISDTGDGEYLATDKAIYFLRWITPVIAEIEQLRKKIEESEGYEDIDVGFWSKEALEALKKGLKVDEYLKGILEKINNKNE